MSVFTKEELKRMDLPKDLEALIENFEQCEPILEEMQSRFFEQGEDINLISHSYLNEDDKKNQDIMNNVSAINNVFQYISFVMETINGDIVGYWHSPNNTDIKNAPIVLYDTEGQFNILNGSNLTEALVGNYLFEEDDEFLEFQNRFKTCGIDIVEKWDDLIEPVIEVMPSELHERLYNEKQA